MIFLKKEFYLPVLICIIVSTSDRLKNGHC